MSKVVLFLFLPFLFLSCTENKVPLVSSTADVMVPVTPDVKADPANTDKVEDVAEETSKDAEAEEKDESLAFKFFNSTVEFRQKVDENWYLKSALSTKSKVVKYFEDYQARVIVDYENKRVRIDTKLKENMPQAITDAFTISLKSADSYIFSSALTKGKAPFLLTGLVKKPTDAEKQKIYLINNNGKPYYRVELPFIENIKTADVLLKKADGLLSVYTRKYRLPKKFLSSMAKTLTSGNSLYYDADAYRFGLFALGEDNIISDSEEKEISFEALTDLEGNVDYAGKYFSSLKNSQFRRVFDKDILEQLLAVSYVMGADNLLHLYSRNKQQAVSIINGINSARFYDDFARRLPATARAFLDKYRTNAGLNK